MYLIDNRLPIDNKLSLSKYRTLNDINKSLVISISPKLPLHTAIIWSNDLVKLS